jgi:hypothetical protein
MLLDVIVLFSSVRKAVGPNLQEESLWQYTIVILKAQVISWTGQCAIGWAIKGNVWEERQVYGMNFCTFKDKRTLR